MSTDLDLPPPAKGEQRDRTGYTAGSRRSLIREKATIMPRWTPLLSGPA